MMPKPIESEFNVVFNDKTVDIVVKRTMRIYECEDIDVCKKHHVLIPIISIVTYKLPQLLLNFYNARGNEFIRCLNIRSNTEWNTIYIYGDNSQNPHSTSYKTKVQCLDTDVYTFDSIDDYLKFMVTFS